MFDLDTLDGLNDRAYHEYEEREKPATTIGVLREKLLRPRPPSISMLTAVFENAETYQEFVNLVKDFLPEREKEILAKPTPHEQMACFASYFEDRYLPLHPSFKDGECEDNYNNLLCDMPIMVMGFGWEEYHELHDHRLGMQLMSYIFESPLEGYDNGERVALADGFPPTYQVEARRIPGAGISLEGANRILKGKRWIGLRYWAQYIHASTGNWFLDTTDEERYSGMQNEWDKELVEAASKEWLKAQSFYDKMVNFAEWLEDEKAGPARFSETVDFILANIKDGDVKRPEEVVPQGCSRGIMRAPR